MGASAYVGRVGGLAVALGIGAAVAVAQAASASADTESASPGRTVSAPAPAKAKTASKRTPAPSATRRAVTPRSASAVPQRVSATLRGPAASVTRTTAASVAPLLPADNPIGAFLAAVRREFFNASPTITPVINDQTIDQSGHAVITGNFGAADADGDTLYYTYIGDPQAGGTLEVDTTTGDFTYTAPADMDLLGGFDQFNITVSDETPGQFPHFHGIRDIVSRIPIVGPQIINALQLIGLATPFMDSVPARIAITVDPTVSPGPFDGPAQQLSSTSITTQDGWQRYVITPEGCSESTTCVVSPVSVYYKNGGVTLGDNGAITLNYRFGAPAPLVILDYGQDVGGYMHYTISGTPNIIQTSYSESLSNLSAIGDGSGSTVLLANSGAPLTFELTPFLRGGEWTSKNLQGGYRYQQITLDSLGSVTLSNITTTMTAPLRSPEEYGGNFLSNSDMLNRIWYAGAYTVNLDEIPAGTPGFHGPYPLSILGEAAKRDRAIWAGDLLTAMATLSDVFGSTGLQLAQNNLTIMADNPVKQIVLELLSLPIKTRASLDRPGPAPGVCTGQARGGCAFWGASYSMALAQNMANYYNLTGDATFVEDHWQAVQRSVEYGNSLINPATGLVKVPSIASLDWSVTNRAAGQVTSTNVIQYNSLTSAAMLAEAIGDTTSAAQYAEQAAALKQAINDNLWNPAIGAYGASLRNLDVVAQDANSWAVLYGVADAEQAAQIVQTLSDTLTTEFGLRAAQPSAKSYPKIVSPFITGFTLPANYMAGRPDLAMEQILATWGYMVDSDAGSTTWERINLPKGDLAGTLPHLFGDSASHAWSTGATSALSNYLVGITPTSVAYQTWQVKPFTDGATWAQGVVPTAQGEIASRWQLGETNFRLTVESPNGTTGTVSIPTLGSTRVIYADGVEVWDGSVAVNGATASAGADGYINFTNITGSHTWAW